MLTGRKGWRRLPWQLAGLQVSRATVQPPVPRPRTLGSSPSVVRHSLGRADTAQEPPALMRLYRGGGRWSCCRPWEEGTAPPRALAGREGRGAQGTPGTALHCLFLSSFLHPFLFSLARCHCSSTSPNPAVARFYLKTVSECLLCARHCARSRGSQETSKSCSDGENLSPGA